VLDVDITAMVNSAMANGGGIRIALVDNTFRNDIKFYKDTGIQAIPEPATLSLMASVGLMMVLRRRSTK
jgi:hypothetical protein